MRPRGREATVSPEVKEVIRALLTGMIFSALVVREKRDMGKDLELARVWAGEVLKSPLPSAPPPPSAPPDAP